MNIYFAGSIRGGREFQAFYAEIIAQLKKFGNVLTEHIGSDALDDAGEAQLNDEQIYLRDRNWILESDIIVAEVSNPSLGVGYELGLAEAIGKRVLCLVYGGNPRPLSAMIAGNNYFTIEKYENVPDIEDILNNYLIK